MPSPYLVDFSVPETLDQLVSHLGFPRDVFRMVVDSNSREEFYIRYEIPKRSARRAQEVRIVWEAPSPLLEAHKTLARRLDIFARASDQRYPHDAAYGFIRRRSTYDNALIHCGAPLLMRADIRNFFPTISKTRLEKKFLDLGIHKEPADALARFVTINDSLPLGLNASPMLANLIVVDLDIKLAALASSFGCKYTRYADDIAISGTERLPSREELEDLLREEGFELAIGKFRITKPGQAHFVTGLSITDALAPHVPREMKHTLRTELYYCRKYGIVQHLERIGERRTQRGVNRIDGTVRYISHVEKRFGAKLKDDWHDLLRRDDLRVSYASFGTEKEAPIVTCYVDETEFPIDGHNYLGLGLVFTEEAELVESSTISVLEDVQKKDPFYAGDKGALAKSGIHFVDAHFDLRAKYINVLEMLSLRAFVVFCRLDDHAQYEASYLRLLKSLLPLRMVKYDRLVMRILVEQNSKVKEASLEAVVHEVYNELIRAKSRRPLLPPQVSVETKKNVPAFAVPDFLLAVFSRYAQSKKFPKEPLREHQFERLRDKYRLIINGDTGEEFSRRNPFTPFA